MYIYTYIDIFGSINNNENTKLSTLIIDSVLSMSYRVKDFYSRIMLISLHEVKQKRINQTTFPLLRKMQWTFFATVELSSIFTIQKRRLRNQMLFHCEHQGLSTGFYYRNTLVKESSLLFI